jgi:hypothetical protein
MARASHILRAEAELDWYFNEAATMLELSAIDPGAVIVSATHDHYTDVQMHVIDRARPILQALRRCTQRTQMVLSLAYTRRVWRAEKDHHGVSPHYDYEEVYGARLAAIVRHYRMNGTVDEKLAMADAMRTEAVRLFAERLER